MCAHLPIKITLLKFELLHYLKITPFKSLNSL